MKNDFEQTKTIFNIILILLETMCRELQFSYRIIQEITYVLTFHTHILEEYRGLHLLLGLSLLKHEVLKYDIL